MPGDPDQVIYVWFDALANYITVLDYAGRGRAVSPLLDRKPAPHPRDRQRDPALPRCFLARIPVLCRSPLPTAILVHGYLTVEGQKISKSLGNTVDPVVEAQVYGPDALRYFLLRHTPAADDSDYSVPAWSWPTTRSWPISSATCSAAR